MVQKTSSSFGGNELIGFFLRDPRSTPM
jgi:hypothetical protein